MFKLVVLFALVAVAVAKPGYLGAHLGYSALSAPLVHSAPLAVAAPVAVAHSVAVPAAVSSTYRKDVISKPIVATYAAPAVVAAPLVHKTIVAAPSLAYSYAAHVPSVHAW
ncbi:cuticle protein 38-like [Aethina tumida]|uniref:cuticle protein 38-like n=1 Tax=Aethina tumida TaxID=116153 RepID=UPI0021497978|nr:cuticle protein 38-like [Aethina tumida]